jgi:hypothetical protein
MFIRAVGSVWKGELARTCQDVRVRQSMGAAI